MSDLPAVAVLAGGTASRLRPLSETVPKAMVRIAGEPFVAHQLRLLAGQGFDRVVLCIGHLGGQIEDFVGDGRRFGVTVRYSRDPGDHLLGTGGALRHALPVLDEAFMILYGDSYLLAPLRPPAERFVRATLRGMMTVYRNDNLWDRSNVVFRDGRILAYSKEKHTPDMTHIDYGWGGLRRTTLERFVDGSRFDLEEVYRELLEEDRLLGCEVFERFYEIGSPEGLAETERRLGAERRRA